METRGTPDGAVRESGHPGAHALRTIALAGTFLLLLTPPAGAYRPFDGTDAGVAPTRRLEIELGPLEYIRIGSERLLASPELALSYGAGSGYEFGVEARRLMLMSPVADGAKPKIDDVELTAMKVLRNGSIQDKNGLSVAAEGALLMPTTDEKQFGAGLSLILSHRWENFALHVNGGMSRTRAENNGRFASLIAEGPERWGVRPVAEASWEREGESSISRALLLGIIWQTRNGLAMDFAIRTGVADQHEVELRTGITWNRHVAGPRI